MERALNLYRFLFFRLLSKPVVFCFALFIGGFVTPQAFAEGASASRNSGDMSQQPIATANRPLADGAIELRYRTIYHDHLIGTVTANNAENAQLHLDMNSTLAMLESWVKPKILAQLRDNALQVNQLKPTLTTNSFTAIGIESSFDKEISELALDIPDEALRDSLINIANQPALAVPLAPANFSGYLNLLGGATHRYIPDDPMFESSWSQDYRLEGAVRLYGAVLENEVRIEKMNEDAEWNTSRGATRLVVEDIDAGHLWRAGDITTSRGHFQDTVDLLGVSLTRDFFQKASQNLRYVTGRRFSLERPADIDVVVDGVTVRKLALMPGIYDLSDIPYTNGSNQVELVNRGAGGADERLTFKVKTADDLLAPGQFDYAWAGGVLSESTMEGLEYQHDDWVMTGYFSYGATSWMTPQLNVQLGDGISQLSGALLLGTGVGTWELSAATSEIDSIGSGQAYGFGLDIDFGPHNVHGRSLTLSSEAFSENFGGVSSQDAIATPLNETVLLSNLEYDQDLTDKIRGGLGLSLLKQRNPEDEVYSVNAFLSGSLWKTNANWNFIGNYQQDSEGSDEWNSYFSLSWPLGKNTRLKIDGDGQVKLKYENKDNRNRTGGLGIKVSAETGEDFDASLAGELSYTANRFYSSVEHDVRFTELQSDTREHTTKLKIESSLAFAGRHFAIGRQVKDSFAIVHSHDSLAGQMIRIDPSPRGDMVHSDGLGPLLAPDLGLYRQQLLRYSIDDLSTDQELDNNFMITPLYRAGYSLEIGSDLNSEQNKAQLPEE